MKHVNLNGQDESVQRFVLSLAAEIDESVLELDGRPVARMVPIAAERNGEPDVADEWTDAKNDRRCDLIDKKFGAGLSAEEAIELDELQLQMIRHRDLVAPLPLEYARKLHAELLKKSQEASSSGAT